MIGKILSWVGGLVVLFVVIGIVAGGNQKTTVSSATVTPSTTNPMQTTNSSNATPEAVEPKRVIGKVGQRVESTGIALSVLKVQKRAKVNEYIEPEAGNTYITVEVVIENTSRDETPYNPLYFKVKDADGFEHDVSLMGADPQLKSGNLRAGAKSRGFVTFEVPKIAKGLVMSYEPLVILGGYEPIEFNLGI